MPYVIVTRYESSYDAELGRHGWAASNEKERMDSWEKRIRRVHKDVAFVRHESTGLKWEDPPKEVKAAKEDTA